MIGECIEMLVGFSLHLFNHIVNNLLKLYGAGGNGIIIYVRVVYEIKMDQIKRKIYSNIKF